MKAVVVHGADDLRVDERPDPAPGPGEVLIAMEWGGICGSDLAYWRHGSSGTAVLRSRWCSGTRSPAGSPRSATGVTATEVGLPVTVHPAELVGDGCLPERIAGRTNLYPRIRYFGSAAFDPHTDGGFSELRVVRADQIRPLPEGVSTEHGALAEPLAVALHAVHRAGDVRGRDVVVNGAGPIGSLVVAAAKYRGAATVVAADLSDASLAVAKAMGADEVRNLADGRHPARRRRAGVRGVGRPGRVGERPARDRPRRHARPGGQPARRRRSRRCSATWSPGRSPGWARTGSSRRSATRWWRCATASTWPADHPPVRLDGGRRRRWPWRPTGAAGAAR